MRSMYWQTKRGGSNRRLKDPSGRECIHPTTWLERVFRAYGYVTKAPGSSVLVRRDEPGHQEIDMAADEMLIQDLDPRILRFMYNRLIAEPRRKRDGAL